MADETTPAVEKGTGTPIDQIPTDFKEYDRWRRTGELPKQPETSAAPAAAGTGEPAGQSAGEPEPQAKTAPDSEPGDSQETGNATAEGAAPRGGARERKIDRLIRENSELQKRLQALEQTRPPVATAGVPAGTPPLAAAGKPDLGNYKTLEEYTEALTDWKIDQRENKRRAEDAQKAAQAAASAEQDSWSTKVAAATRTHPDFAEVMEATVSPEGPGVMAARQALLEDDNGAEVLYWLASRPTELKRIAGLSPHKAVLEIGKLTAALASPVNPDNGKPKVSGAPKPISPMSRSAAKSSESIYDEDFARRDFAGWSRVRAAQLKG